MIETGFYPGKGVDILNTFPPILKQAPAPLPSTTHFSVWYQLHQHIQSIIKRLPTSFIPEVGINIGYALPKATTKNEICALSGRIINTSDGIQICGNLRFGGSIHISSIILAAMKHHQQFRSAMNIAYSKDNLSFCTDSGLTISSFDRTNQPKTMDSTMEWGTSYALEHSNNIPDIVYDTGSIGKEPMIRIIATNPLQLYQKLSRIIYSTSS
jgi:hydroxymethylpyrimidine/phosphomethylpyrimidine kinase